MELSSSDKERIQHQYDALAKKTLVGEAKSHRRTLAKRAAREVTFSDLSEKRNSRSFSQRTNTKAIISVFKCPALMYSSKMNCLPKPLTLCPKGNATLSFCPTSWI